MRRWYLSGCHYQSIDERWCVRIVCECVKSRYDSYGHILGTADRPRVMRCTVINEPALVGPGGVQYCPELRIPLSRSTGLPGRMPAQGRAAAPGISGATACPAIFAWCVFMAVFLFTIVNTKVRACRILYPDFASCFAARYLSSCRNRITERGIRKRIFAGNQGIITGSGQLTIVNFRDPAGS